MKVAPPRAVVRPATSTPDVSTRAATSPGELRSLGLVAGWFALLLPFVGELAAIMRSHHVALVRRLPDDAFYYFEIAAHVGRGQGFTFDGIHSTNGFHPLWQFMLVPLVRLFGSGTDTTIRAALVLALLCSLAAVLLFVRLVWHVAGPGPALLGGIVATQFSLSRATQFTPSRWINGMESPVVLLAVALLATALAGADRRTTPLRVFMVGLASAALVLARLDFAPLLLIVGAAVALRWRSGRSFGNGAAGVLAVGLPSAVWWFSMWGHVLSTSATVKDATLARAYQQRYGGRLTSGYANYIADVTREYLAKLDVVSSLTNRSLATASLGFPPVVSSLCGLALLGLSILGWAVIGRRALERRQARTRNQSSADSWALAVVLVIVVAKAALDIISAPLWASQWYSAPQRLAIGFVAGAGAWYGVRILATRARPLAVIAIATLAVLALPVNAFAWDNQVHAHHGAYWQDQIDIAADWVQTEGPTGRYGANDAGLLGYRLDRVDPVVNLDGLVNDYDFAEIAGNGATLIDRIHAGSVEYFVGRLDDADLATLGSCGRVLWESPKLVPYADSLTGLTYAPVRVVDVHACIAER